MSGASSASRAASWESGPAATAAKSRRPSKPPPVAAAAAHDPLTRPRSEDEYAHHEDQWDHHYGDMYGDHYHHYHHDEEYYNHNYGHHGTLLLDVVPALTEFVGLDDNEPIVIGVFTQVMKMRARVGPHTLLQCLEHVHATALI